MRRGGKTWALTVSAMMTALSLVFMYLSAVLPTMQLAMIGLAALLPIASVLAGGVKWGALTYAATALLSLILVPDLTCSLLYTILFGHYGVTKSLIERLDKLALEWVLKILQFNVMLALWCGLLTFLGLPVLDGDLTYPMLFILFNLVFVMYDIVCTRLISMFGRYFHH